MKIATFNINNVVKRLDNLIDWLAEAEPDVACLQELKAEQGAFPAEPLAQLGYNAVWKGQRSWNGVAILAKDAEPIVTRTALPGDPADSQARYIEAAVNGVLVVSLYLPNGNPRPGPKFDHKLAWFERLIAHAQHKVELYMIPKVEQTPFAITSAPGVKSMHGFESSPEKTLDRPEFRLEKLEFAVRRGVQSRGQSLCNLLPSRKLVERNRINPVKLPRHIPRD